MLCEHWLLGTDKSLTYSKDLIRDYRKIMNDLNWKRTVTKAFLLTVMNLQVCINSVSVFL